MTDLLRNEIKMLNLMPANKAAAEVLRRMGGHPSHQNLLILDLASEILDRDRVEYGNDLYQDLADLNRHLTPEIAKRLTQEIDDPEWLESLDAKEAISQLMDAASTLLPFSPRTLQ